MENAAAGKFRYILWRDISFCDVTVTERNKEKIGLFLSVHMEKKGAGRGSGESRLCGG